MAATVITYAAPVQMAYVELGTAGNIKLVTIPKRFRRVRIKFLHTNDTAADTGKVSHTGAEDAAIGEAAWHVGTSGDYIDLSGTQDVTLRITGTTSSGHAHLLLEEYPR